MATSGLIKATNNKIGQTELYWNRISYSAADNNSTISWELRLVITTSGTQNTYNAVGYTVEIDNNKYTGTVDGIVLRKVGTQIIATGVTTIPHNTNGTKSFNCSFSFGNVVLGTYSGSSTETLDTIPKPASITSAVDFNDEENPLITYNNISGELVDGLEAAIYLTDGVTVLAAYRNISKNHASYVFNLTDAERKALRAAVTTGNSTTVRFYITTVIEGVIYWSYLTKTLTLVNYEPTLSPTAIDTNSRTVGLTGNNNTFIRYFSNARLTFGATAHKEATLISKSVTNGSQTIDIEDRAQDTVTINGVDSNTFYLSATDSRGYQVKDFLVKELIPYIKLTNNIRQTTLTFNGDLTFVIGGKYFDGSFGAKSNTLEVEYSIQDEDGNYITNPGGSGWQPLGTVIPDVDSEGNYTFEYTVGGLEHEKQYTLTVNAIDELTPVQSSTTVVSVIPVFEWGKSDFRFNVPVYLKDSDVPLTAAADFVVEQGTSGTWFYRKWNSGRAELYGYQNISNVACTTALGNMYRTAVITPPSFPFTVNSPKMVATYESEGYGAFLWPTTLTTTAKPFNFYLVRPTSSSGITGKVNFHVQGSWQ